MDKHRVIETERLSIALHAEKLDENIRILDIGGGGEGIISKLYQNRVVAIDIREDELSEVDEQHSLKIVMDATDLAFMANQFDRVTAFYSLMYFNDEDVKKTIKEVTRVIKPGGLIEIWDTEIPSVTEVDKDIFIVYMDVSIGNQIITTGYGTSVKEKKRDMSFYLQVLEDNDFIIEDAVVGSGTALFISARMPG